MLKLASRLDGIILMRLMPSVFAASMAFITASSAPEMVSDSSSPEFKSLNLRFFHSNEMRPGEAEFTHHSIDDDGQ